MARRSTLVAIAAIVAVALPATAQAGTPTVTSAAYATPVALSWTLDATLTETVYRLAGACPAAPVGGTPILTSGDPAAVPAIPPTATSTTDTPGEGRFCYYVQEDGVNSAGAQATVDLSAPTGTVAAGPIADGLVRGTVTITGTSADAGSGVASSVLHRSAAVGGNCADGPAGAAWDTTTVADGVYGICNVITDNAGRTFTALGAVIVDNTPGTGTIAPALAGAFVGGDDVRLTMAGTADQNGIRSVRWQRSGTGNNPAGGTGWPNIGGVLTNAPDYGVGWNTTPGAVGEGPDWLRAQITDNAGNVSYSAPIQVIVDNSDPDVAARVTAPPAVAGSPILSWTPAHDTLGIDHYEVRRSATAAGAGTVIGAPIVASAAANYSYADAGAPDQATSYYTVRAFDHVGRFRDSRGGRRVRRLEGAERRAEPHGGDADRERAGAHLAARRPSSRSLTTTSTATG